MIYVVQFTAELPPIYIAEGGGLCYQFKSARQWPTKAAAEAWVTEHKMPLTWEAVGYDLPPAPVKLSCGKPVKMK
jgi:hypothetical protein